MKKIITAIGNEKLNLELKKISNIKVIYNDISYKEGIIESLEENSDCDILILNENLDGEIFLEELIEKIKIINNKIFIILITYEKNINKMENPYNKINYIFYKKIELNNLLNIIFQENNIIEKNEKINSKNKIKNNEINIQENNKNNYKIEKQNEFDYERTEEKIIDNNLEYIKEFNNNYNKINSKKSNNNENNHNNYYNNFKEQEKYNKYYYKNYPNNKSKKRIIKNRIIKKINNINFLKNKIKNNKINNFLNSKIISFVGNNGVGKSIISVNLSKINSLKNKKILLIDYDIINNSIKTILGIKTELNNKNKIIKINKNIDLITIKYEDEFGQKKLGQDKIEQINYLEKIINKLKNNYDYIFIDTNSNLITNTLINILKLSDLIIFISDTNLLEINKSIKLLDIFISKYKINKINFLILFNKYNSNSIDINLLKNIFYEFNILGYLKYSTSYNKLINKNNKYGLADKKLKKEYLKISEKLFS